MAGKTTVLQKTYKNIDADGISLYTGVTYGNADGECKKPTTDNEVPIGVVDNDEVTGVGNVAVHLAGIAEIKLSGNVSYGDRVILGAGGVVKKMPTAVGVYNVIGFAEKAGADGDVIPVRLAFHAYSVTA